MGDISGLNLYYGYRGVIFRDHVSTIAITMSDAEASASYGTPAFKIKKKLFARLKEDGKALVAFTDGRDKWMKKDPGTFFITDHDKTHPMMLISLSRV